MIAASLIAASLFVVSGALHGVAMAAGLRGIKRARFSRETSLVVVLSAAGLVHIITAGLYALGYRLAQHLGVGELAADGPVDAMKTFYFSLVTYTSLGLGDIIPEGHLRLIAGVQALNGFLLISCSAAMLFAIAGRPGDRD